MADTELQNLAITTSPLVTDLLYTVLDPATAPKSRQVTIANLFNVFSISLSGSNVIVDINGGTIDGASIGSTTPAAGAFTTLKAGTDPVDEHGVGDRGFNDARYLQILSNLSDVNSALTSFDNIKQAATETYTGVAELATTAEVVTGTDTSRIVTAAGVTARLAEPGEIGGTTPGAGHFTTLNTSGLVVFNNAEADVDFRVATLGGTNALFVEGSSGNIHMLEGLLQIGAASGSANVNITPQSAIDGIYINQAYDSKGIHIDSDATSSESIRISSSRYGIRVINDIANGYGLSVSRNNNSAETYSLVSFINYHASDTKATLELRNVGSGPHITTGATNEDLEIDPNGTGNVKITGNLYHSNAAGPTLLDEAATGTNPTVVSNRADTDTGLGWTAADQLSLVSGAREMMRLVEGTDNHINFLGHYSVRQQNIPDLASKGPSYWFDGSDDRLTFTSKTYDTDGDVSFVFSVERNTTSSVLSVLGNSASAIHQRIFFDDSGRLSIESDTNNNQVNLTLAADDTVKHGYAIISTSGTITGYQDGKLLSITGNAILTDNLTVDEIGATSVSTNTFHGEMDRFLVFNLALTAAEVKALSSGAPVPYKYVGASQTNMITDTDNQDFGDGTINEWVVVTDGNGTVTYDAGPGAEKTALVTVGGTPGTYTIGELSTTQITALEVGKTYRISADVYIPSANNNWTEIKVSAGGLDVTWDNNVMATLATEDSWQTISREFEVTGTDVAGTIRIQGSSTTTGDLFYFDNVSVTQIGCVLQLEQDGIGPLKWRDKSGNDLHGTVSGAVPVNTAARVILPQVNDATTPTLAFGDGDSGIFSPSDGALNIALNGNTYWHFTTSQLGYVSTNYPILIRNSTTSTVPNVVPNATDTNTGIGSAAADQLSLIAGGIEGIRIKETGTVTTDQIILFPAGAHVGDASATPTLAFGDGDTGFYEASDDELSISVNGSRAFKIVNGLFLGATNGTGGIANEIASSTNPSLLPYANSDNDTGIGWAAADQLSLIAGGKEMLRLVETGVATTDQIIIAPAGIIGAAATPALAFGDGDSGFYESSDDTLSMSVNGARVVYIQGTGLYSNSANGGALMNQAATGTVPGIVPDRSDLDTGIGQAAEDQLSLISGGVEGVRISEDTTIQVNAFGSVIRTYTVTTDNTDGAATHTIAELLGGLIRRGTGDELTGNVVDVTDTAANIVAGIKGCAVGSGFEFFISNEDSTHTIQLDGGVGVTISPNDPSTAITANSTGRFLLVVTNATPASEAVTVHALGFTTH